jgi:MinD-like ATPase involved in chromosome partitioning or flagellar assembly
VQAIMGSAPDVLVPSDRDIPRHVNEGRPIVGARPRSDAAQAFRSLARTILDDTSTNGNGHKPRRRFGRRKG